MSKKILIIDESEAFGNLVKELCQNNNLESHWAINGLDGNNKIRSVLPDLIIVDTDLSRMDLITLLKNKKSNPNTTNIPVILVSKENPSKDFILKTVAFGVKKFLKKPIGMEGVLSAVSEVLHINTEVDNSPCVLEVRLNENIIFVEVAMGLNRNRLEVVKYKIAELIKLHRVKNPQVLLMMTDIPFNMPDRLKLTSLIHFCIEGAHIDDSKIRILTPSEEIKSYLAGHLEFYDIKVEDTLEQVMMGFVNKTKDDLLFNEDKHADEAINANYRTTSQEMVGEGDIKDQEVVHEPNYKIAVVDDDKVVHAIVKSVFKAFPWEIHYFTSGEDFLKGSDIYSLDLVILDLLMPGMSGFDVLENIDKEHYNKIVVLTSSSQRNDVMKVLSYGVKNYMVKPINGENLKAKALELLKKQTRQ